MGPAGRAALLLLPVLVAALAGCTVARDLERFLGRLRGEPELVEVAVLERQVEFSGSDASLGGALPTQGTTASLPFRVGEGAVRLRVEATVTFESPDPAPPAGLPRGRVNVSVLAPSGLAATFAFTESGARAHDDQDPEPGEWRVEVQALGRGRVQVLALATEPAG